MAERHTDPELYAECLAAMAVSGDVYPCETLTPAPPIECALPPAPATELPGDPAPIPPTEGP